METGEDKMYVQTFHANAGLLAELKLKNKVAKEASQTFNVIV